MYKFAIGSGALLLSACVAGNGPLAASLENFHQRKVQDLFAVLGPPAAETSVAGQEVYVWGDPRLAMLPQMNAPAAGTANADTPACTIRVFVNPDARIASWDILGNEATCAPYMQRLSAPH